MTDPDDLARRANAPEAYDWTTPRVIKAATDPTRSHIEFTCGHEWQPPYAHTPKVNEVWLCVECWSPRQVTAVVDPEPRWEYPAGELLSHRPELADLPFSGAWLADSARWAA